MSGGDFSFETEEPTFVTIQVRNSGKSPAYNVRTDARLEVEEKAGDGGEYRITHAAHSVGEIVAAGSTGRVDLFWDRAGPEVNHRKPVTRTDGKWGRPSPL